MKIECEKCQAKYSIADEKVKGKTFKIRCKKCSNVIIVRDKAGEPEGGEAPAEPAGWHLAINGETVGPVSDAEVRRKFAAGEIDLDTSIWQEGFDDWLSLGTVPAFEGLAGSPQAPAADMFGAVSAASRVGDDPFGGADDDSAFAGSSALPSVAAAPMSSPSSYAAPRAAAAVASSRASAAPAPSAADASALTGQRNENSVLFSLENLQAIATSGGSSRPATRSAPSTSAPSSEGSGLIDIRAMGAVLGESRGGGGGFGGGGGGFGGSAHDDDVLPTFGGGLSGLAAQPLVHEAPPLTGGGGGNQAPQRSNAVLYGMIGVMGVAILGLGAYVVLNPPPEPQVIEKLVQVPGEVKDADKSGKDDDDGKDDEGKDTEKVEEAGTEGGAEPTDPTGVKKAGGGGKKKAGEKDGGGGGETKAPVPVPDGGGGGKTKEPDPDVDCLLDPSLPKCGKKSGGKKAEGGGNTNDASLPPQLTPADIQGGIGPVKGSAAACGPKNGAAPGTKVAIKFSINGPAGSVISATALEDAAGKPLGNCVAAAAKKATFKKTGKNPQGFTFKFTM